MHPIPSATYRSDPHYQLDKDFFLLVGLVMTSLKADRKIVSRGPKNTAVFHIPLRQLTVHPSQSHSTDLVPSNDNLKDIEKGLPNSDGPFDTLNLRECLTSFDEANKAAGIQPKHVGVTWENLQVTVGGSIGDKVRTCLLLGVGWILTFKLPFK